MPSETRHEEEAELRMEVTERRGRRLTGRRRGEDVLNRKEAINRTVLRTGCRRDKGPVVRQTVGLLFICVM